MISKDKAKCYIYTRVSTAIQVDGYSLDAQRETMRKYADFQNMEIVREYSDEGHSGTVIWKRAGYVRNKGYDHNVEKQNGILGIEFYSDKDWDKYGDNIALAEVDSDEWRRWIAENWDEELFRRRMNYTLPNYEKEDNIIWFADLDLRFDLYDYEKKVDRYWKQQTLFYLNCYDKGEMTFTDCVKMIKSLSRNGEEKYEEHMQDFGEVLLHIYVSDEISNPLYELLLKNEDELLIEIYSKAIELMWKYGTEEVVNVVDVTILERLSDDINVWNRLGKYISEEFKEYINHDLLKTNIAMCGVRPME